MRFRQAYPHDPILVPRPDLPFVGGRMQYQLLNEYRQITGHGRALIVPAGYITDGASIPRFAWSLVGGPMSRPYLYAALPHDFRYEVLGHPETIDYLSDPQPAFIEALLAPGWRNRFVELIERERVHAVDRASVDADFRAGIAVTRETWLKSQIMWRAVRIGGGGAWRGDVDRQRTQALIHDD
ncbi:MAG: DUF1353 domain-containing protein [Candidatus Thiodiazotropha sp. (ex Dulcina madagascariensis)]|nr:DUF1353 domain-containing protein [Candidatus Thiodiazotropha sp. (ex Dulcina madagascariensis)]